MSALDTALDTIDAVAGEGDLVPTRTAGDSLELESVGEPIALPDGRRIYPPRLHGQPVDELACALLDMTDPARSTFLRLIGPPGAGAIAHRLWTGAAARSNRATAARSTASSSCSPARPRMSTSSATTTCRSPARAGRSRS
jgi:hypothetical protein